VVLASGMVGDDNADAGMMTSESAIITKRNVMRDGNKHHTNTLQAIESRQHASVIYELPNTSSVLNTIHLSGIVRLSRHRSDRR